MKLESVQPEKTQHSQNKNNMYSQKREIKQKRNVQSENHSFKTKTTCIARKPQQ